MSEVVNCIAYSGGHRIGPIDIEEISDVIQRPDHFVWVGLHEPGEEMLRKMQLEFCLHDLAVEDAHMAHQRPKIERYGDSLFVVLRTVTLHPETAQLEFGETHLFLGEKYLLSVRHGSNVNHLAVRARCEANPAMLKFGPAYALYSLMDFVVDNYFPVVHALEAEVDKLEEVIFEETLNRDTTSRIYELKSKLMDLKRAVAPLVDVCNQLMRFDFTGIPEGIRPYFRDVYDHTLRINESVEALRELLTSALEANLAMMSVAQNEVTKRLAAWAAIIAVPTMVAGIYGMNFQYMPELHWKYGYAVLLAVLVLACTGLYWKFKRSGWL